jgi:uncharacterized protein
MRLLIFVAFCYFAYRLARSISLDRDKPKTGDGRTQQMVRCDHCGLFVPTSEAVQSAGRNFCSDRHRIEAQGRRT